MAFPSWQTEGVCLVPAFLTPQVLQRYRQVLERQGGTGDQATLQELIAHPQILDLLAGWYGDIPHFHGVRYVTEGEAPCTACSGTGVHVRFAFEVDGTAGIRPGDVQVVVGQNLDRCERITRFLDVCYQPPATAR